ncbi:MAG: transporter substrate-binding domain-containing protein [Eggerthellaceae bacterium]|nr:transporter substrate-binding domain-containing protein [Eggerthellaceae bacterium]
MKRWKIGVLVCAIVACLSVALVGCQGQDYKPEGKSQTVSSTALSTEGTLRVGVNASSAPLAGQTSSSSRIVGIDVDVAAYIADQLGCKVEIVDVGNDPASALADGRVDIVLGVDASSEDAGYWKSASYLQSGVALFGTASESAVPTTDSNPKIAAQASSKSSWRVTNLFGDDALVVQSDLKSAFDALAKGSARYVAADAVIGTYVSHTNAYDAKIIALLQDPSGYCVAVAEKNTELQGAVASAVDKLVQGGVIEIIESKWLGAPIDLDNTTIVKAASADQASASSASASASDASADAADADAAADEEAADEGAAEEAADEGAAEGE